jgi:hypothetical protein
MMRWNAGWCGWTVRWSGKKHPVKPGFTITISRTVEKEKGKILNLLTMGVSPLVQ